MRHAPSSRHDYYEHRSDHEGDTAPPRTPSEPLARQHRRGILNDGTLQPYIRELSVTGLTANPTIFDHAITNDDLYDDALRRLAAEGKIPGTP
jgi:hypothetical protein